MPRIKLLRVIKQNKKTLEKNKEKFDKQKLAEFKQYIEGRFREYMDKYIIIDFVNLYFHYKLNDNSYKVQGNFGGELVFNFDYNHPYRQCHINIHRLAYEMWDTGQTADLENGMLHELSHLHTDKLAKAAENRFILQEDVVSANEELTQIISEYVRRIKTLMEDNINKSRSAIAEKEPKQKKNRRTKK